MNWEVINDLVFFAFWSWVCFRFGKWYAGGLSVDQVHEELERLRALHARKAAETSEDTMSREDKQR
jgi:hypothetical protein